MATISLPSGRNIDVIATVNASLPQQVEIVGPGIEHKWEGSGEGKRIGQAAISIPPGVEDVKVEVKVSYSPEEGSWSPSHEKVTEEREIGEIHVIAEDGRGALDGNDLIVRFRWVA